MEYTIQSMLSFIREKREASSDFPFIIAIDGRCASGKTTAAQRLSEVLSAPVVHMDDFFLRPHQRTSDRLATPGENIDHERFLEEVIISLKQGRNCVYAPFSCATQKLLPAVELIHSGIVIVEGSYAHHTNLRPYYSLCFFLTVSPETQLARIKKRNGETMAQVFKDKWIPLEEAYFSTFSVAEKAYRIFSPN